MASSTRSSTARVRTSGEVASSRARSGRPSPRSQSTISASRCDEPLSRRTVRNSLRPGPTPPCGRPPDPAPHGWRARDRPGAPPSRRAPRHPRGPPTSSSAATMTRCWATPSAFSLLRVLSCWWTERSSSLPVTPSGDTRLGQLGLLRRQAGAALTLACRRRRHVRRRPWRTARPHRSDPPGRPTTGTAGTRATAPRPPRPEPPSREPSRDAPAVDATGPPDHRRRRCLDRCPGCRRSPPPRPDWFWGTKLSSLWISLEVYGQGSGARLEGGATVDLVPRDKAKGPSRVGRPF